MVKSPAISLANFTSNTTEFVVGALLFDTPVDNNTVPEFALVVSPEYTPITPDLNAPILLIDALPLRPSSLIPLAREALPPIEAPVPATKLISPPWLLLFPTVIIWSFEIELTVEPVFKTMDPD